MSLSLPCYVAQKLARNLKVKFIVLPFLKNKCETYIGAKNPMENIEEFVSENKDHFELIATKRNIDNEVQEKALKTVRQFIADRDLILYGGIAIDYALKLKGSKIYSEDTLPDFDMYSPQSITDSYDLAEILIKEGFENVDVIRALHVQTQRVRILGTLVVADISYCPKKVYDSLKYLQYQDVKVIHPDYQRIDMHVSLSYPFDSLPRIAFSHRWKKDIKRLNLFEEKYPIEVQRMYIPGEKKIFKIPQNSVIGGIGAYALLYSYLKTETKEIPSNVVEIHINVSNETVTIEPCPEEFVIISNQPEKILSEIKPISVKTFYNYMDWIPSYSLYKTEENLSEIKLLSTENRMLSISEIKLNDGIFRICSPQYIMSYFLSMYNITNSDFYKVLYYSTMNMVKWADKFYSDPTKSLADLTCNPFLLPLKFLGSKTEKESQLVIKLNTLIQLNLATPAEKQLFESLPRRGFYPSKDPTRPKIFDYNHPMFRMDGSPKN